MAVIHKVLGQAAPANTNVTTLYTVPAGVSTIVSTLSITNVAASAAKPKVYVRVGGAAAGNANTIVPDFDMTAKSVTALTLGITLSAGDVISVETSAAGSLTFMLFGQENI